MATKGDEGWTASPVKPASAPGIRQRNSTHKGIGDHLLEGRQAAIIAACAQGDPEQGRVVLAGSTLTQPWEHQVAACLDLICSGPDHPHANRQLATAAERLSKPPSTANLT